MVLTNIMGTQGFPKFDALHAHCAMNVTFKNTSCRSAFNTMHDKVEEWAPEPNAGGMYAVWDSTVEENLWATRTTPTKKYVDDILFDYFSSSDDFNLGSCRIQAKSRSQTLSIKDYNTNYCNMWNVIQSVPEAKDLEITTSECRYVPQDPATTCKVY